MWKFEPENPIKFKKLSRAQGDFVCKPGGAHGNRYTEDDAAQTSKGEPANADGAGRMMARVEASQPAYKPACI